MLFSAPLVSVSDFEARSGWHLGPEGLCREDVCVPVPPSVVRDGNVDLSGVARALGMPLLHDEHANLWALGPSIGKSVLPNDARAPELTLPDAISGKPVALRSLLGKKILLLAWASW